MRPATAFAVLVIISAGPLAAPNFRDLGRGLLPVFANAVLLGASF